MEAYFGPITPFLVATIVSIMVQAVKAWLKWDGWKAFGLSILFSFLFVLPYHLVMSPEITAVIVYQAIFYSFMTALMAAGLYGVNKLYQEQRAEQAFRDRQIDDYSSFPR